MRVGKRLTITHLKSLVERIAVDSSRVTKEAENIVAVHKGLK